MIKRCLAPVAFLTLCMSSITLAQSLNQFADEWKFMGPAVQEPGYHIWGTSPVIGDRGKVHLFVARWPQKYEVDPGWRSHSETAHYVGDRPEGPFTFSEVAIKGTGQDTWDKYGAHNPTIQKVDEKYALLYIANSNPKRPPHPANQQIGMAIADSPYGPWEKVGKNGSILAPPKNTNYWNYQAPNGVNNPALLHHPDGGFFLYFKSSAVRNGDQWKATMGLAIAENLEGPYVQLPFPVTANNQTIEDGYAFIHEGQFKLLTTDNHGIIKRGGGVLWSSNNGITFTEKQKGFHRINKYTELNMSKAAVYYGSSQYAKFERPQVLMIDGEPEYLYVSSGINIYGGDATISYVLKNKK